MIQYVVAVAVGALFGSMDKSKPKKRKKFEDGGKTGDKPKIISISESFMKMDGDFIEWSDMDNAIIMWGRPMDAEDVYNALARKEIYLDEYAPELFVMKEDEDDEEPVELKSDVTIDDIVDAIEDERFMKGDNTYNYNAPFVFDFRYVETDDPYDEQLYFVREHRGGDVRGNYGNYMAVEMDSVEENPLYGRIDVQMETEDGKVIQMTSEDVEGYTYEIAEDTTGTFEQGEYVKADEIEEAFDFADVKSSALNIFAHGGVVGDKLSPAEMQKLIFDKTGELLDPDTNKFASVAGAMGYAYALFGGYWTKSFAHGGKTHRQGYDDKLDESLAMRRGAGRTKQQSRKDRRDESAGMERSMGRRKYASVGTMDKGRRKMAHGGFHRSEEGYKVLVYAGSYQFLSSKEKNEELRTLVDAIEYAKRKMREQRDYRPTTEEMYASIQGGGDEFRIKEDDVRPYYAHGGKTHRQGYDDKLDESLGMRRGAGRSKQQSRKDRRDESAGMERSMGRRKYASVGTMDKGRRTMEKGGKTGRETITYNVYNIDGNVIRSAESIADFDKGTITLPNGKKFKVKPDLDFTMKFQKTQIKAKDGLEGLVRNMKEFSSPDSAFNLLYADKFAPKEMEKGGTTKKPRKKVSDFDKLAMKVAARYRAEGKSNEEAMEIGRGTAAKVYRQQQGKKGK